MRETTYCEWYDKPLADVAEHEQEQCGEYGMYCSECQNLTGREIPESEDIC